MTILSKSCNKEEKKKSEGQVNRNKLNLALKKKASYLVNDENEL